jgi:hydrophobic/amphiphilic exporter-1 (mainly G- bacteria), HAE1 family
MRHGENRIIASGYGVTALFVRRPVLALVLNLLIVIAGVAAFLGIEVRELPNVDRPVITIRTDYEGATPETVDKEITAIIEGAIARTPGVASISSESDFGDSRITVEFNPSTDINVAANDLRDAIGNLRDLPEDSERPRIIKADADSDAIMRIAVISSTMAIQDLTRLVDDRVVDRLAAVEGVADIQVYGDRDPVVQIIINPDAIAARHLTVADINEALSSVSADVPAGDMSDANRTLLVRADASARSLEEIEAIQINSETKVSDIADVIIGPADRTTSLRINGQTGLGLGVIRQPSANTLTISDNVRAAVDELNGSLPDNVELRVTSDDAVFIGEAIHEVEITLFLATLIVIAIIYVFLRSARVTFIPAVTVPVALIGTLAAMWVVGFSINIMTLLALVLATGLVVDDAIVVIENISRQRSLGLGPRAAAVIGLKQVFFAVLATTATLAAVFIPISFFPGIAGRIFVEFGFVLAFAVVLSSIVAITLCPMLASKLIGSHELESSHNPIGRAVAAVGDRIIAVYRRLLDGALAAPMVVVLVSALFAGAAVVGYGLLPQELTPAEDRGFVPVSISAPQGSTVDYTVDQMRQVEEMAMPVVESGDATNLFAITRSGGSSGFMFLTLAPWNERERSQMEISAELNRELQQIPGLQINARNANSLGLRGGGQGVTFAVTGPDYATLAEAADTLIATMEDSPYFGNIRLNYDTTQPQLSIYIDRQRATDAGVPVETIASVVKTLLSGRKVGEFYVGDDPIEIRAQVPYGMIQDPAGLDAIQVRTPSGSMVPLSSFVTFEETAVAPRLPRQDKSRAIPITAALGDGVALGQAMDEVLALAEATLPPGMGIAFTGEAKELAGASGGVYRTFAFALIIVLLVLAAQFESFISAFILMATVPFGLAAAVFAILLSGGSLNIYSQVGLVMIVGLMAKNGILIVEFANQLRDSGQSVGDAIRNSAIIRLRPVAMTMLSTVLGGLPLVLRSGAGAEAREALGWIIVGGLGFATVATLFLTPVAYLLLARFSKPRIAEENLLAEELADAARPRPVPSADEFDEGSQRIPRDAAE